MSEVHRLRRDAAPIPVAAPPPVTPPPVTPPPVTPPPNEASPDAPDPDWASLVASRICHDLVSPLGAIANGMELLALTGLGRSPEAELIAQSVGSANARVRFFRVAFGAAGGQVLAASEARSILAAMSRGSRTTFEWHAAGDPPRREARAVFLLLMCLERAMAHGGTLAVAREGEGWLVTAQSPRLRVEPELWTPLAEGRAPEGAAAATVQFALLPAALAGLGRALALDLGPDRVAARF